MIEARGLVKHYGSVRALDGVDLEVGDRGVVGLLGPNGAGKTTLMRILTGFLSMTEGTARVAGFDVFEHPREVKTRVGYLPETPALYGDLRVGEMVTFAAELRSIPDRARRVGEILERVGLESRERALCNTLSRGLRQRVGLACALVHDPRVLILDEPTTGLDPVQVQPIRALIRTLGRERPILLSTHVLGEVEALCDRVVVLHEGRIRADRPLDGLGARAWSVALRGEGVGKGLVALSAVERVEPLGADRYLVHGDSDVPEQIGNLARTERWTVTELAPQRIGLEDAFLEWVA